MHRQLMESSNSNRVQANIILLVIGSIEIQIQERMEIQIIETVFGVDVNLTFIFQPQSLNFITSQTQYYNQGYFYYKH